MKKEMKKILAAALTCAMSIGLLAGCGGASDSGSGESADAPATEEASGQEEMDAADEQQAPEMSKESEAEDEGTIRVVTFLAGSDQWAPVYKEVINDYMAAHPGVTIVDESQPTSGTQDLFRTKVQSDVAAKTPPDLMLYYNGEESKMPLDSELFVDLKPYMDADPEWSANLKEGAMEAGRNEDGMQYCIPYIGYFEGMFYNKELFDQYGLEEPTSWENIEACIDVFVENDIVPFATSLMKPSYMVEQLILAQVGAEGQKDYFDNSWAPALAAMKDLYDKGAFPADCMTMTEDDIRVLFADGKAAMMINGSWTVSGLKDNENMRMITMPALPGGKGGSDVALSGFGSGWYMSKEAAERDDVTLHFLKYMTSPEVMTRMIAVGGSSAITCDAPEGASPLEISANDMLNTATKFVAACDSQVVREAWLNMTEPGIQYIATGQSSPEDILAQSRSLNEE
ncbi:ABC transporter substrate-binding protein [Parablautia muri]|uniref:Extracellular solute-binding protein n=1 Tax=Parablautia muri TaxID=2320879 RepID=A0A9X5GSI5_9FIRM|nr:extracellular solute-binding protein [Parablautia muri]NBJ93101.1 extracellular solute-binding protein [Parablautia muri]